VDKFITYHILCPVEESIPNIVTLSPAKHTVPLYENSLINHGAVLILFKKKAQTKNKKFTFLSVLDS
jgi:hypothetical protein